MSEALAEALGVFGCTFTVFDQFASPCLSSALQTTHGHLQGKSATGFQSSIETAMNRAGQQMLLFESAAFHLLN